MLIENETQWLAMLDEIHNGPPITVYDLETTGLDSFKGDRLVGIAILVPDVSGRTEGKSYYAPFRHSGGLLSKNLSGKYIHHLIPILADPDRILVGFNIKFDVHFTEAEQMKVKNRLADVMLAAHLADENELSFALKHLGAKYISSEATQADKDLRQALKSRGMKSKGGMQHLMPEEVAPYAEQDVRLTWQLNKFYIKNLKGQGISDLLPEVNSYLEAIVAMERQGILIDPKECKKNLDMARRRKAGLYKKMKAILGRDFNPDSVPQLRQILGQHSTDKYALAGSKHPLAPLLIQNRAWGKAASTFYQGFLDSMDSNSRIHPNLVLIGTISGRLSCRKPNMQALPKRGGKVYRVRDLVIAPPGYVLMSWDWSQTELRLLAHYSRDSFLVDAFQSNKDIHQETSVALNLDRDPAKRINFGVVYGIGSEALSDELNIPVSQAQEYLNRYHRLIPGVRRLYNTAQRIANRDHQIPMWTGRLRHYRQADATHKALSNLIQGGVAEMMRVAITRLHYLFQGTNARQILQIHDEILFEIPEGEEETWAVTIKEAMEGFEFDVPIVAEGKMGYSWGESKMLPIKFDERGNPVIPRLGRRYT